MPTYEYRCLKCHKRFEKFQRISDPSVSECPSCGGKVERVITGGSGILFKGSGFYATDYRSESYKKAASKEKESDVKVNSSSSKDNKSSTGDKKDKS